MIIPYYFLTLLLINICTCPTPPQPPQKPTGDLEIDAVLKMMDPILKFIKHAGNNLNAILDEPSLKSYVKVISVLFKISEEEAMRLLGEEGREDSYEELMWRFGHITKAIIDEAEGQARNEVLINTGTREFSIRFSRPPPQMRSEPIVEEPETEEGSSSGYYDTGRGSGSGSGEGAPNSGLRIAEIDDDGRDLPLEAVVATDSERDHRHNVHDHLQNPPIIPEQPVMTREVALKVFEERRRHLGSSLTKKEAVEYGALAFVVTAINLGASIKTAEILTSLPSDTIDWRCKRHAVVAIKSIQHGLSSSKMLTAVKTLLRGGNLHDALHDGGGSVLVLGSIAVSFATMETLMHLPVACRRLANTVDAVRGVVKSTPGALLDGIGGVAMGVVKTAAMVPKTVLKCVGCIVKSFIPPPAPQSQLPHQHTPTDDPYDRYWRQEYHR